VQIPENAQASFEASIEIAASPAEIYAMVSDITRMGEWSPENVGGVWLDGGTGQVGDRFEGNNRSGDREWSRECEVARADPGADFTFVVGSVEANCTWWSYEMESVGDGARLTERWWYVNKTPGLAAATPEQLQSRIDMTQGMLDATVAGLKNVAEKA
jgi:hypothetical protein